ncbi:hypothetical protein CERZMDRAFT_89606 [Cercospora zeae-maydis SCOH1-5]|uniref:Uncharacterized protein n=1 Tax=Cercospora zeae-maydis SCOH1-5 TaxID=717836 RepID=A0A6A6FWM7_9PEZI|nr:hypothetical protein CERZMDRAFT_89606 [Cercospora zeae-maydis SCOH1-5]
MRKRFCAPQKDIGGQAGRHKTLSEHAALIHAAKAIIMQLKFSLALASVLLAASICATPIPEPPNLPTDVTNMIGGPKWLKSMSKTYSSH